MLLYNLSFPSKAVCDEQELYFRGGEAREDGVFVKNGDTVTFDTYFNCFSHIKYKKYTKVAAVTLGLEIEGGGVLSICRFLESGDETLVQKSVAGPCEVTVDISDVEDKGFLYFKFEADGDAVIRSGGWYAEAESRQVKIGIVICTYRREEYVRRNIANLTAYMKELGEGRFFDVFVIDNGQTLKDGFGEGVEVIPNENTGGSGGFTRGMKEVCARDYTHFLLMDDDILFDVNILRRTASMLAVLKDEYKNASIGGAMLILDRPYMQQVLGDDWDGLYVKSHRKKVDVRNAVEVALNEEDKKEPDYNAWFYMCMPVSSTEKYGYPLPLFIKLDDAEYGLRAAEHIITSSGIAVWHEDFNAKYSPELEYYSRRNLLITHARYPRRRSVFSCWMKVVYSVGRQLVLQRYFAIDLIFKACDDFLKGPQWLVNLDSAKMHTELRKLSPKFLTAEEIVEKYGVSVDYESIRERGDGEPKITDVFALLGYFVPKCFYKKGVTQINMMDYAPHKFALKSKVLQFNPITGKGFVTEIKKSQLWKSGFKLIGYFFKMTFKYRAAAKKYAKFKF